MNFFGIPLRRPRYAELTSAVILATGLWLLVLGLVRAAGHTLAALDAAALLVVIAWSCIGVQIGIRIGQGGRHLAANLTVSALLLGLLKLLA